MKKAPYVYHGPDGPTRDTRPSSGNGPCNCCPDCPIGKGKRYKGTTISKSKAKKDGLQKKAA